MAVIKEFYRTRYDGVNLYRNYSDDKLYIKKVGTNEIYAEAIDVEDAPYIYVETAQPIEDIDELYKNNNQIFNL